MATMADINNLTTEDGILAILAIDHRDSLRVLLNPDHPEGVEADEITAFKRAVVKGAVAASSGVMLEPEYSIPQLVEELPAGVGFLAALEAQGYEGNPYARTTNLLEGWSPLQAMDAGASAAKLLIFYTPDAPAAAARQEDLVREVASECARLGLPLFLEPLAYPSESSATVEPQPGERQRLVVETARRLTDLGATVLKMQFPADHLVDPPDTWSAACRELDAAVTVPWALLSLGASYEVFRTQVDVACRAGASGFMVGRAAWGELVDAPSAMWEEMAAQLVAPRIAELRSIVGSVGRPAV